MTQPHMLPESNEADKKIGLPDILQTASAPMADAPSKTYHTHSSESCPYPLTPHLSSNATYYPPPSVSHGTAQHVPQTQPPPYPPPYPQHTNPQITPQQDLYAPEVADYPQLQYNATPQTQYCAVTAYTRSCAQPVQRQRLVVNSKRKKSNDNNCCSCM